MGWPTGADTRNWMRQAAVGLDVDDLQALNGVTRAATDVLSARLDPSLLDVSGDTIVKTLRSGGVATLTTSSAHHVQTGDSVTVTGVSPAQFDGTFTVTAADRLTFSYALDGSDLPEAASTGSFATVDRCPDAVRTAIMIRAANYFVRRDSAHGIIRITPDQVIRINRYDSDVDELLGPYLWGPDPAPGED